MARIIKKNNFINKNSMFSITMRKIKGKMKG